MISRAISAFIAVIILSSIAIFLRETGLVWGSSVVALIIIFEYTRLSFKAATTPRFVQAAFFILAAIIYFVVLIQALFSHLIIGLCACIFMAIPLIRIKTKDDLHAALQTQMAGILGFIYVGLFPALIVKTLLLENGLTWFFLFLSIVFAGDTFAYLFGKAFGKDKLLEAVSPKKTVQGSLGGLVGSTAAAILFHFIWIKDFPIQYLIGLALLTGIFAQVGDLFESLIKRVADVKDSGSIMPGHGGLLDRMDGLYFAAPVYFIIVFYLTQMRLV